jgi:toxin ParE1/3/4
VKRVVISAQAEADLDEIDNYITARNPTRAESFIEELYRKALNIGAAPLVYPKRPDLGPDLRAALHKPYLIVFHVKKNAVEVVRIVHGARDLPRLLRD